MLGRGQGGGARADEERGGGGLGLEVQGGQAGDGGEDQSRRRFGGCRRGFPDRRRGWYPLTDVDGSSPRTLGDEEQLLE